MKKEDYKAIQEGTYVFRVGSKHALYSQFEDIYPDVYKNCWGFNPFNWDDSRRSILIDYGENARTKILFEVSKNPESGKWTGMRCLLIPKGVDAS